MTQRMNEGKRLLLVEDNEKILRGNKRMLEWDGYTIDTATTLKQARERMAEHGPDAIVLDIMLPDGSGLAFMQELRQSVNAGIPILLLTGLTTQEDILRGLKSGGDDYLTKPYDFEILLARIASLLRRSERVPERITWGKFTLDVAASVATLCGVDLLLTQKEFALLLLFIQNPERSISGEYLESTPQAPQISSIIQLPRHSQASQKCSQRDRSLLDRFRHSKAIPITQNEVSGRCAMIRFSP